MTRLTRDVAATALTATAVLVLAATREGWDVPLVGDSHRWAAVVILVLGVAACSMGRVEGRDDVPALFAGLGTVTALLAVWAVAAGSVTALSLMVTGFVLLWAAAMVRHVTHRPGHQATA
ncbi:MAG: hypothetical protein U0237_19505 [Thermoleophilia bacterium]